jgi:choline dehydrogenase-like flavoprotein
MAKESVIVVGSGAGGSVTAWALRKAGHSVLILEKGRNLLPGVGTPAGPRSLFGNDEVKSGRFFENQDVALEPRTSRTQQEASNGMERSFVGDVNTLPTTVGGGTIHWDAKTPRFWRQDFKGLSLYGPVPGANVADWPLAYDDLAPFYDEVERQLGVQGDVTKMPASTLAQAPRSGQFPMPPNPPMLSSTTLAAGASALGYHPYPFPMAVASRPYDGRPPCNSCGFCSGWGCPINARGGAAASFLHHALLDGAELRSRCFVTRVELAPGGKRAVGVSYLDASGAVHHERADIVVLAPSAIETARLALLSATSDHPDGLGNRSGQLGRNVMFHFFTLGVGLFSGEPHAWRGPASTTTIDDFVGPERGPAAQAAGVPYLKGGICEVGGGLTLLAEAGIYSSLPGTWGTALKNLMRTSPFRAHLTALSMVGEDMPQLANRVDLDPKMRDVHRLAVPRITYSAHRHEVAASFFYGPKLQAICAASPGNVANAFIPIAVIVEESGGFGSPLAGPASTAHIMGTARMGTDPATSVVDPFGRMHELDNVYVADGSVFVSSGGFNPTVTIMALALRMARHLTGAAPAAPAPAQAKAGPGRLAATGGSGAVAAAGATAAAAGLALRGADRRVQGSTKAHPSTGGSHGEGQPDP